MAVSITTRPLQYHFFPCTIKVMDSEKGLGDHNMDFLFGLDMLKRHRCKIDLEKSALVFGLPDGQSMEALFLHEKDLDENKGGGLESLMRPSPMRNWKRYWRRSGDTTMNRTVT